MRRIDVLARGYRNKSIDPATTCYGQGCPNAENPGAELNFSVLAATRSKDDDNPALRSTAPLAFHRSRNRISFNLTAAQNHAVTGTQMVFAYRWFLSIRASVPDGSDTGSKVSTLNNSQVEPLAPCAAQVTGHENPATYLTLTPPAWHRWPSRARPSALAVREYLAIADREATTEAQDACSADQIDWSRAGQEIDRHVRRHRIHRGRAPFGNDHDPNRNVRQLEHRRPRNAAAGPDELGIDRQPQHAMHRAQVLDHKATDIVPRLRKAPVDQRRNRCDIARLPATFVVCRQLFQPLRVRCRNVALYRTDFLITNATTL